MSMQQYKTKKTKTYLSRFFELIFSFVLYSIRKKQNKIKKININIKMSLIELDKLIRNSCSADIPFSP
jgi:hypothetical protein